MSIATEITRLQGAKDALKTAIEGKGVQVPSSALIDAYPDLVDQIQQGGGESLTEAYRAAQGYIDLTEWSDFISELASVTYGMQFYFTEPRSIRNRAYGEVTINASEIVDNAFAHAFEYTLITKLDVSSITKIGSSSFSNVALNTALAGALEFPNLEWVGQNGLESAFQNCTGITSVSFPKLATMPRNPFGNSINYQPFRGCTFKTAHIHPKCVEGNAYLNMFGNYAPLENLTFSEVADSNVNLSAMVNLTSASVLDVLNHLSLSATGKTCTFGNLTIPSSDANHAAIAAKVASLTNWTISGLTI